MLFFWKVRGLNEVHKQKRLKAVLNGFISNLICLLETHVQSSKQLSILHNLLPNWNHIDNYEFSHILGRIWLIFDDQIKLEVYCKSKQALHCHIFSITLKKYFFLSVIHGSNCHREKRFMD